MRESSFGNTGNRKKKKKKLNQLPPSARRKRIRAYRARALAGVLGLALLLLLFFGVRTIAKHSGDREELASGGQTEAATQQVAQKESETEDTSADQMEDTSAAQADVASAGSELTEAVETTEIAAETDPLTGTVSITISAVGDCALGKTVGMSKSGSFLDYYEKNGKEYFFSKVKDIFEADDLTIANLEGTLTSSDDKQDKKYNIRGPKKYAGILTAGSIEAVSLGNNHTMDYGEQGLQDTKDALDSKGVVWALDETLGRYTTDSGVKIGIVSVKSIEYAADKMELMAQGIETLKAENMDLIVVCVHWGVEKDYDSNEDQSRMAHELVDAGADLVLGCHPHVLQGVEVYNGKVICYSLGNFCFGANKKPSDVRSMIFQQTFTFEDGVLQDGVDAQIIPCRITSTKSDAQNDYQPKTVSGDSKQEIIDMVNESSAKVGNVQFDDNGKMYQY